MYSLPPGAYSTLHIGPADGPGMCVFEHRPHNRPPSAQRIIWRFAKTTGEAESYLTQLRAGLIELHTSDGYEPARRLDVSGGSAYGSGDSGLV